jgi:cell division initiation protein
MLIEAQLDLIQSDDWDKLLEYEINAEQLEIAADKDR